VPVPWWIMGSERTTCCERCGNPVTEREMTWIRDATGHLRMSTRSGIAPDRQAQARFWHAGCLYAAPYPYRPQGVLQASRVIARPSLRA
jgi:hypothetical protein